MAASTIHATRPNNARFRTPTCSRGENDIPSVGSSCTWKQDQLDLLHVKVEREVSVKEMIPPEFFVFERLEWYEKCNYPLFVCLLMAVVVVCVCVCGWGEADLGRSEGVDGC